MCAARVSNSSSLEGLLLGIRDNTPEKASRTIEIRAATSPHPAMELAFASICALHALRPKRTRRLAHLAWQAALATPGDSQDRMVAAAACALARAWGEPEGTRAWRLPEGTPWPDHELCAEERELRTAENAIASMTAPASLLEHFLRYQLAEARLACGEVAAAVELVDSGAGKASTTGMQPIAEASTTLQVFGALMRSRALLFAGRVSEASAEIESLSDAESCVPPTLRPLVLATRMLVAANADQRSLAQRLVADLLEELEVVRSYRSAGLQLLIAYGFLGIGDLTRAASRVHLSRSCGPLLEVDHALSLETLLALASAEGDAEAAEAWYQLLEPQSASRISAPAAARCRARILLLRGDPTAAETSAELAARRARSEGRQVEAAEAEILAARARIASHQPAAAASGLAHLLELSEAAGHLAARRAAAQEMRAAGRRLLPTPGSAWAGLSEREREVALLIAAGLSNTEIATTLFLSPHTVRAHVSRVLTAFSAASRLMVASRVAAMLPAPEDPPPSLTARQHQVALGVERGLGNEQIAHELGISIKTVEKHLTEIHRRWGVRTRTGVARLVRVLPTPLAQQ